MASFTTGVKILLPMLSVVGILGTWVLSTNNGTFSLLEQAITADKSILHGTQQPLQSIFTGIRVVDDQLKVLVGFFLPIVDGRTPSTSLLSLHFGGQLVAAWVLCVVESFRTGNRWRVISL